jgi:hypothetical protein
MITKENEKYFESIVNIIVNELSNKQIENDDFIISVESIKQTYNEVFTSNYRFRIECDFKIKEIVSRLEKMRISN